MVYRFLADIVLILHFAFVLFVVLGALFVFRWPRLSWFHLPAAAWGAIIEFAGWRCPLTPLEVSLRRLGGEGGYSSGFIDYYVRSILYPGDLPRATHNTLGVLVLVLNLVIYVFLWRRHRKQLLLRERSN
jgi:Protein of Unknown function (DUF2784)